MNEVEKLVAALEEAERELGQADVSDRETERLMLARYLVSRGTRVWGVARWCPELTYKGKDKELYRCSACGHYQSAKRRQEKMMYMRYCPFCGRRMVVKAEAGT